MALAKKTVNLLRKIEAHILEEPKRLEMDGWGCVFSSSQTGNHIPPCRTQGCIAGWAILLKEPRVWKDLVKGAAENGYDTHIEDYSNTYPSNSGRSILGLKAEEAERLFYVPTDFSIENSGDGAFDGLQWPKKFTLAYRKAKTPAGRARATVNRIEHFIKTDGAE